MFLSALNWPWYKHKEAGRYEYRDGGAKRDAIFPLGKNGIKG
jgi:hypothetical protein